MKQATIESGKGIGTIAIADAAVPQPAPGEALVRIRAATLNFRDLIVAKGLIPGLGKEPRVVPLSCCVAEVVELGEGSGRVAVGDRVVPIFAPYWLSGPTPDARMLGGPIDGVARQYAVFPVEGLCAVPDSLGDLDGATLACAGLTAWSALTAFRPTSPGDWVLCHGTGGVSVAALQLAKAMGAQVAITSSSAAKLARAAALGADLCIDTRATPDWASALETALGPRPIANVIDTVGAVQFEDNARLLGAEGQISAIGMLGSEFSWTRVGTSAVAIAPIGVGNRDQHEAMTAFVAAHAIRPVVDVVFDLARLQDAYRHLESGAFFGKVGINLL
ncbi:zinc-dependent alcohol dehydrogenase family protein [Novosphingobium soli]|uniref:NAD(P)-dependent alcohol dehydrogenase n=1 Tax=Novosphingobium soli TaxID=574956 RepID=A0ABV6CW83_9SPHN